ncbi:hypothetical protein CC78DRAFT_528524 [Lojkania enalia]|uniref:Mitotic checkpoint regulator, MAD2B-interacting-domain-containing protein n=1 Tax=Lojkania enalia TaxID=147567 RepID=A0A9P4TQX2_9PLEO|nr:hypothetical protein CC78DRAFT_528524 [Didymosphaeria enalia]
MNLIAYSDSDESDNDAAPALQPAVKTAPKPTFQKVVDRSSSKIKLDLPAPKQPKPDKDDIEAEAPPAKKARTGGGFAGFNALLPAPKKANATATLTTIATATSPPQEEAISSGKRGLGKGLGAGVSLKTGAEPAFKREPKIVEDYDETGTAKSNESFREFLKLPPPKTDSISELTSEVTLPRQDVATFKPEAKPAKKPMKFVPLSVNRGKKKKPVVARPVGPAAEQAESVSTPTQPLIDSSPAKKPKVSLFSVSSEEQPVPENGTSIGEYKPLLFSGSEEEERGVQVPENAFDEDIADTVAPSTVQPPAPSTRTGSQSLIDVASELNLTEAERRRLFGRKGRSPDLYSANIVEFNTDQEYAHNMKVRAEGETVEHKALKSISGTGKNSLRSLINVAVTQKDALEEHFNTGRRNKKEAGNKYGW